MAIPARVICEVCAVERPEKDFFMRKDHSREPICKKCLTRHIDNQNRQTFEWILEKFDVPYIEAEWIKIYNKEKQKKGSVASDGVLGKYLRLMKINQFSAYTYADTEKLQFQYNKEKQEVAARLIEKDGAAKEKLLMLQQQLDNGEITQEEFDKLNPINEIAENHEEFQTFDTSAEDKEKDILAELTDEEVSYLRRKWGAYYKPSQWIQMEEMYIEYENEYELNVDRKSVVKQICQVYLKMNEALAIGDMNGHKALAATYDSLRKSAKFTDAQNKEGQEKYLDSIGELVKFCEEEKGLIEQMPNPDDYPQDKIDFTIKDIKNYIRNLVVGELGLGDLIESYVKKLEEAEKAKAQEQDLMAGLYTSEEEVLADALTDQEAEDFSNYLENELEDEAAKLAEILGGDGSWD